MVISDFTWSLTVHHSYELGRNEFCFYKAILSCLLDYNS